MVLADSVGVIEVPSSAGPCVYLRRDVIEEIGPLASGLGDIGAALIDFGLRARRCGWRHVAAADVFVPSVHQDGLYGAEEVLGRLHPGYGALRQGLGVTRDIAAACRRFDERRLAEHCEQTVLLVTLARNGGVRRHVAERASLWRSRRYRVLELKPAAETSSDGLCRVVVHNGDYQDLAYRLPDEFDALAELLQAASVVSIEYHHTLGLDPLVLQLPERLGAPYDIHIHDYSWICPRITLIGADGAYCREPPVATCETCVSALGSELEETIPVEFLRLRSQQLFLGARSLVMPTRDTAARLRRHFPGISPVVRPWEDEVPATAPRVSHGRPFRVAVIGSIGVHKGYDILLACARDAADRELPVEFVVFGHSSDDAPLFATGKVFVTGPYDEAELPELLAREACNAALFASVWPETWNYALTYALRDGLPIVAFDLGGIAERLRDRKKVVLLPLGRDPAHINDALLSFASAPNDTVLRPAITQRFVESSELGGGAARAISQIAISIEAEEDANLIEYKVLSADGELSEWCPQGGWCGGGEPILAFAVRATRKGTQLRCRYDGWFRSGAVVRNIGNGNPCRSRSPDDPLVALHLSIVCNADDSLGEINDSPCRIPELSFSTATSSALTK
jgi:glycosyltransferase involved in cell wall biosynthesis